MVEEGPFWVRCSKEGVLRKARRLLDRVRNPKLRDRTVNDRDSGNRQ